MANANAPTPAPSFMAGQPDGMPVAPRTPYFDGGDADQVELVGTAAYLRAMGLPVDLPFAKRGADDAVVIVGSDGYSWRVWSNDGFFVHAERARTEVERVKFVDGLNTRVQSSWFTQDRQDVVGEIAYALHKMASHLSGDRPVSRAVRRAMKKQLTIFSEVQMQLAYSREVDMIGVRALLAEAGLEVKQRDYLH